MATPKTWETGGKSSIGGTAVQLTSSTVDCRRGILVKAAGANTAKIYVGESGVTSSTGFELAAGEQVVLPVLTPSEVYVVGASGSQAASFVVI